MTDSSFWDRAAAKYAARPVSDPDAYETTLTRTRSYLGAETTALELGCGTGTTALKLYKGTRRYVASDISTAMIGIACAKLDGLDGVLPEFRVGGVGREELGIGEFNTILAFNLLHLIPDLDSALSAIHDALPENGLFISKTPAIAGKWYFRPIIKVMQAFGKAPYVSFLSVEEVDERITDAGFRIIETDLYPPSAPSRFVVARKT